MHNFDWKQGIFEEYGVWALLTQNLDPGHNSTFRSSGILWRKEWKNKLGSGKMKNEQTWFYSRTNFGMVKKLIRICMHQKCFSVLHWGLSRGSCINRPESEDPHQSQWKWIIDKLTQMAHISPYIPSLSK